MVTIAATALAWVVVTTVAKATCAVHHAPAAVQAVWALVPEAQASAEAVMPAVAASTEAAAVVTAVEASMVVAVVHAAVADSLLCTLSFYYIL